MDILLERAALFQGQVFPQQSASVATGIAHGRLPVDLSPSRRIADPEQVIRYAAE